MALIRNIAATSTLCLRISERQNQSAVNALSVCLAQYYTAFCKTKKNN